METADEGAMAPPDRQGTRQRLPTAAEQVRVKLDTIQSVIDQCQRALKLLEDPKGLMVDPEPEVMVGTEGKESPPLSLSADDSEAAVLCEMVKSKIDSQSFLEKIGCMNLSVSQSDSAWDMISKADLWDAKQFGSDIKEDQDGYVLVNQEDIVEGITSFMAAYLLSLKETKHFARHFQLKRRKLSLEKHGKEAKLFIMLHHGVQLPSEYTKTQQS